MHFVNLFISDYLSTEGEISNPCKWYFVIYTVDVVFCTFFNYLLLLGTEKIFSKYDTLKFKTGYYGLKLSWMEYFYQLFIWLTIVMTTKILLIIIIVPEKAWLGWIGDIVLNPFKNEPKLELIFVMIFYPMILNIIALWITDNFLKMHDNKGLFSECFIDGDEAT